MTSEQVEQFKRSLGIDDGDEWDRLPGSTCRRPICRRFIDAVPIAQSGDAASSRASCRGAVVVRNASRGDAVDAAGIWTAAGRHRPRASVARRPYRDDVARRDRVDQPGRVGEPSRHFRCDGSRGYVQGRTDLVGAELVDVAAWAAHRARHRREQSVHPARGARAVAGRCSDRGCCRSERSTTRSSAEVSTR